MIAATLTLLWGLAWLTSIGPQGVDERTREELTAFLERYFRAIDAGDLAELGRHVDMGELLDAALAITPHPEGQNILWRMGSGYGFLRGVLEETVPGVGETLEVLSVDAEPGGERFTLRSALHDDLGSFYYTEWTIEGSGERSRIVEITDLDGGHPMSAVIAAVLAMELDGRMEVDVYLEAVDAAEEALSLGLHSEAERILRRSRGQWPELNEQILAGMHCAALLGLERGEEALLVADALHERNADAWLPWFLRARALGLLGRHAQALASLDEYEARLRGSDGGTRTLRGALLAGDGRKEEALEVLGGVLDETPDHLEAFLELAKVVPRWDAKLLRERFLAMREPSAALDQIAHLLIDWDQLDALETLALALAEVAPEDPVPRYYLGELFLILEQYESAIQHLRVGLEHAPAEELLAYQDLYLDACWNLGVELSAYESCPDREEAFAYLADGFLSWGDYESLAELLDLHREAAPDDPWLALYEALAAWRSAGDEASFERLRSGWAQASDEELLEAYRWNLIEAAYQRGEGLRMWKEFRPLEASFHQLLMLAFDDGDLELGKGLVAAWSAEQPRDPKLEFYEAYLRFLEGDCADAKRRLRRAQRAVERDGRYVDYYDHALVRSCLRLGQHDQALRHATAALERFGDPFLLAVVYVARGDEQRAREYLQRSVRLGYHAFGFYLDPDIGSVLRDGEAWADFRAEFPPAFEEQER